MKLTIENTDELVAAGDTLARIWRGTDEDGVPVVCIVLAVSPQTHDDAVNARFAAELLEFGEPARQ